MATEMYDLGVETSPMTAEEFKAKFLRNSGMSESDFERMGFHVEPCRCGRSFCEGWQVDAPFLSRWLEGLHGE